MVRIANIDTPFVFLCLQFFHAAENIYSTIQGEETKEAETLTPSLDKYLLVHIFPQTEIAL